MGADVVPTTDSPVRHAALSFPATGGTAKGTAGGPAPDQVQAIYTSIATNPTGTDQALYTVPSGKTFFLTDFVVTGTPASGNPLVVLKYTTLITSGAIATGSQTVSLASTPLASIYGNAIFVGQYLDIEPPGAANHESVKVTAVTTNATTGVVTGFTATFANTHASTITIGVPIEVSYINATKGIEEIGIESQPTAPPGSVVTLNVGAYTGGLAYNVRGFAQ